MSKRYGTPEQRFWWYVQPDNRSGCWEWCGPMSGEYGRFRVGSGRVKAHRYSYELNVGPIPSGMVVRHRCDNPICVNPEHLEVGTHADNVRDMDDRKRRSIGENHNAKLTEAQVLDICAETGTHRSIAERYCVSHNVIGSIKRGEDWKHVTAR